MSYYVRSIWPINFDFGKSVNPIPTKGADYAHYITTASPPPGFLNSAASLSIQRITYSKVVSINICY